ncbi:P-loop NTPase [Microbacterium oleivorans]|uniref:P-loop NTPase n=1 Tax=Microbacterium oleivorans TaxID=273677 RepID=UPI00203D30A5|nr:hypothetical protein [Microbacterium oleivorans]MCM3695206.1 hypothetical protein [Microbacterium oleivorans]
MSTNAPIVNAIRRGEAVLLTGAGFSRGLTDHFGDLLPVGQELAKSIWPIAFPDEPFDAATALAMVYEEALRRSQTLLGEQLGRHFNIDRALLPERYVDWYSLPWHRVYTLNIDDSDHAVADRLPDRLQIMSALSSTPGSVDRNKLAVVHVNGVLDEFPNVTFSPWEFAGRTAAQDSWYQEFVTDISTRPTVVIGSVLDESPLWHYMQLRGSRGSGRELRPKSWLVTPKIDPGRRAMLQRLNFEHQAEIEQAFFERAIAPHVDDLKASQRGSTDTLGPLLAVDQQLRSAGKGSADFLLGAAPTWGDVADGFAATFAFDNELLKTTRSLTTGVIAVTGSAGSGKSTSLMRTAAALASEGLTVVWLDRETESSISHMRSEIARLNPDVVFVDDLDRFAGDADHLLRSLMQASDDVVIVASVRSARFTQLRYAERLNLEAHLRQERLTDEDAEALISALSRSNRLGALLNLSHSEQLRKLTERDDRQLLVSLIEATSGQRFHDRVADECRSLTDAELSIYGLVCTSMWADNRVLSKQDVLFATTRTFDSNSALNALLRLEESRLVLGDASGYRARHRVVAESSIDYFREEGLLEHWLTDLIFLCASHYTVGSARQTRYGRLLIRLINHRNLKRLVVDTPTIQRLYGQVEQWLTKDPHYWLQRGSFETDYGDFGAAENFLRQARALSEDDALVDTAWSMLLLKRSVDSPTSPSAQADVNVAIAILKGVMLDPQRNVPHTFAVFLSLGLRWLRSAPIARQEKLALKEDLLKFARIGSARFATNPEVRDNADAAERWLATNFV